jgi:hypothetical protein
MLLFARITWGMHESILDERSQHQVQIAHLGGAREQEMEKKKLQIQSDLDREIMRRVREDFPNVTKAAEGLRTKTLLTKAWTEKTASALNRSEDEVRRSIDRVDGQFPWQH